MKLFIKVILFFMIPSSCVSSSISNLDSPKYKIGDCLMVVDLPRGQKESRHRVRIEKIDAKKYYYRWLLDTSKWDSGLSSSVGEFKVLEKITKKVYDCPSPSV